MKDMNENHKNIKQGNVLLKNLNYAERFRRTNAPFAIDKANISLQKRGRTQRIVRASGIGSIEYVIEGSGTVTENDVTFQVHAGDVFILHGGAFHDYFGNPDDPWKRIWVQTSGPVVDEIYRAYGISKLNHIPNFDLEEDLRHIHSLIPYKADVSVIEKEGAKLFLELVQKIHEEIKRREEETEPSLAESIRNYIDSAAEERLSLEKLSEEFHFSKQYLIRVFKNQYGIKPYEYFINRRVALVQSLLKKTNLSVEEIATQLHLCDGTYLTKFFHKHTGMSPLQFRKKYKS